MSRTLQLIVAACLLAAAFMWWRDQDAGLRQRIQDTEARVAARETVIAVLAKQKARVDTVAGKAVRAAFDSAAAYQKIRASIMATIDTTATVTPPIIVAADAAIRSCTNALQACADQVAVRDALLAQKDTVLWAKDSIIDLERERDPGRFGCAGPFTANTKGAGLGAACGLVVTF